MNLPTIKWHCNSDDDFVGKCKGWVLRAERMGKEWWWALYSPNPYPHQCAEFDFPTARTMNQAVDFVTSSFYFHYLNQKSWKINNQ